MNPYSRFDQLDTTFCRQSRKDRYINRTTRKMVVTRSNPGSRSQSPIPDPTLLVNLGASTSASNPNLSNLGTSTSVITSTTSTVTKSTTPISTSSGIPIITTTTTSIPSGINTLTVTSSGGGQSSLPTQPNVLSAILSQLAAIANQQQQFQTALAQVQAVQAQLTTPNPIQAQNVTPAQNVIPVPPVTVNIQPPVPVNSQPPVPVNIQPPNLGIIATPSVTSSLTNTQPSTSHTITHPMFGSQAASISPSQGSAITNTTNSIPPMSSYAMPSAAPFLYSAPVQTSPYFGNPTDPGPKDFLRRTRQMRLANRVSDDVFLREWVPTLLGGPALDWYFEECPFATWDQFETGIKVRFERKANDEHIKDKISERIQRPQETVCEYAEALQKHFGQLNAPLSEREKVRLVMRNLRSEIKIHLAIKVYENIRDLIDDALAVERLANQQKRSENSSTPNAANSQQKRNNGNWNNHSQNR